MTADRIGRGNGITADEADQVLRLVAAGKSVPLAASLCGWTDRTIYRWAATHADYRARLDAALIREYPIRHGTAGAYNNHGCRCSRCRAASAESARKYRSRVRGAISADPTDERHGTTNGYFNYGCRCERCRQAASVDNARQYQERKQAIA